MFILTAPLFGPKHLSGLGLLLVLAVLLVVVLRYIKASEKNLILFSAIIFWIFEIVKITYMIVDNGKFPMNHLPFHLCSIPLYVLPILYFSKSGSKLEKYMKATLYGVVPIAGIAALVLPTNIIGSSESWFPLTENILPMLSFIFHGLMIFIPFYMVYKKAYVIKYSDIRYAYACTLTLMVGAMIVNALLDKDYMLLNTGNGSPLQFLLDSGQVLYTTSMILLGLFVINLNFSIAAGIKFLMRRINQ